jgi:hypothetical protein
MCAFSCVQIAGCPFVMGLVLQEEWFCALLFLSFCFVIQACFLSSNNPGMVLTRCHCFDVLNGVTQAISVLDDPD